MDVNDPLTEGEDLVVCASAQYGTRITLETARSLGIYVHFIDGFHALLDGTKLPIKCPEVQRV